MEIAKEKNINFLFEASCGGGIPIIRALNSSLTADEIDEITGILNGTTNYMLYKMSTENCDFDTVLKEAQAKGYAEADPTADVGGADACRKIAILSSLAYGKFLNYEDIYTEGITKITPEDMVYAEELGMTIKLLGTSRKLGADTFTALVAPFLVGQKSPLYSVKYCDTKAVWISIIFICKRNVSEVIRNDTFVNRQICQRHTADKGSDNSAKRDPAVHLSCVLSAPFPHRNDPYDQSGHTDNDHNKLKRVKIISRQLQCV